MTSAGMNAQRPDVSRDGKKLAFIATRPGTQKQEMWMKSLDDGRETLLVVDEFGRARLEWSRDGTRLAYGRSRIDPGGTLSEARIAILPTAGGDEQILTSPEIRAVPNDWSPDGEWIIGGFFGRAGSSPPVSIAMYPISAAPKAETKMRLVTSDPAYNLYQAHFSPDGRWICFIAVKATEAGSSVIRVMPASGGAWTQITEEKYWADKPRWSPDGKTIYFISNRVSGFLNVWGIRFDPIQGKPVGEQFQVTKFEGPGQMVLPLINQAEIAVTENRLVLPIMEVSGSIWTLDNVDR